jgi:hypothetical protein
MRVYTIFLTVMCLLFVVSGGVLLVATIREVARSRRQKAVVYFGLALLAGVVAGGFYFFRRLL